MRINHDKKSELYNVESRDRDRKIIKYLQNVIGNRIKDATNFDKLILIWYKWKYTKYPNNYTISILEINWNRELW